MKNLKETSKRIRKAIKQKERIVLFADSDLDGVVSAIVLKETIEHLDWECCVYLSRRDKWGHGLSKEAVFAMQKESPALLISLDCGISSFEGARIAKDTGFELIIIDHHETHNRLPEASLILDPKQEGDDYPFKKMANAGIVFKLVQVILEKEFSELEDRFLQLTTLATIADMVPHKQDNKEILDKGIPLLLESKKPPFSVLKKHIDDKFIERTVSLLNITRERGKLNDCFIILSTKDENKVEKTVKRLKKEYEKRDKVVKEAEKEILQKTSEENVIVFEKGDFPSHLAGSVASRVIKQCKKPVFLYKKEKNISRGSVRMPSGHSAVKAMESCKEHLQAYGGHPAAAGFVVKNKDIDKFKKCLIKYFQ